MAAEDDYEPNDLGLDPSLGGLPFDSLSSRVADPAAVSPASEERLRLWEERRRKRQGATQPQTDETPVGTSPLAQELEQSGFFAQQEAAHAAQREKELQEAIARSQASAPPEAAPKAAPKAPTPSAPVTQPTAPSSPRGGSDPLEAAYEFVRGLPPPQGEQHDVFLVAQGTPEGHWRFLNQAGEMWTAGNPQEVARAASVLYPDAPPGSRVVIYLTDDTQSPAGLPPGVQVLRLPRLPTMGEVGGAISDAGSAAYEAGRWGVNTAGQIIGGGVSGIGSFLQSPDVAVSSVEHGGQAMRMRHLDIAGRIDRGESPFPRGAGALTLHPMDVEFSTTYRSMTPEQRAAERARIQAGVEAFNPTPIQDRMFYQAGETVQKFGRDLIPQLEGFDENSWSTQVGRGLGSMILGLGTSWLTGPVGGGILFAGMGTGEATQRAVQFDQAERAAGRDGLTQEQIILAGLLGVGPGTTDIVPIENMLGRLRIPGLTPQTTALLARIIGRTGGRMLVQATLEGGQEGLQQFLQNLIAREVYNPQQDLGEGVPFSSAVGFIVGGAAEGGRSAAAAGIRRVRGGRGGTTTPGSGTPSPAPTQPGAPEAGAPAAGEPAPQAVEPEAFGFDLPAGTPATAAPEAAPAAPQEEAAPVAPQAETPPEAAAAAPEGAPAEREVLARIPTFEDVAERLPLDGDSASFQQRLQEQYGVESWEQLSPAQRVQLYRQLGVEAQEREAAAPKAPAALPETPAGPEGQLQAAIDGILQDRPEDGVSPAQMAERFASPAAVETRRKVEAALPQWTQRLGEALAQRGVPEGDVTRLVNESVEIVAEEMQTAGVSPTLEAIRRHVYDEGQKAAIAAIDAREPQAGRPAAQAAGQGARATTDAAPAAAATRAAAGAPSAAAAPAEPAGAQRTVERPARSGEGRAEPGSAAAAEQVRGAELGVRDGERAAGGAAAGDAGAGAEGPPVQNLVQFAQARGLTTDYDVESHIHAGLRSAPQTKTYQRWYYSRLQELQGASDATKAAYKAAIAAGEIQSPPELSLIERTKRTARGHPDNPSVQAARRLLAKRGIPFDEQEEAQPVTVPTTAQRSQLRGILASRFPLNWGTIQKRLDATPEQMEAMRQEAVAEGLLRRDRDGGYKRTPQAPTMPSAGPEITIAPEDRVEGAIRALGKDVSPAVRTYAVELLTRLGSPSFMATLGRAKADKGLSAADVRDLAAIAGTPVAKKANKATAFASIQKRHEDHKAFLERQAVEAAIDVELASFSGWTPLTSIRDRLWALYVGWKHPNEESIFPSGTTYSDAIAQRPGVVRDLRERQFSLERKLKEVQALVNDIAFEIFRVGHVGPTTPDAVRATATQMADAVRPEAIQLNRLATMLERVLAVRDAVEHDLATTRQGGFDPFGDPANQNLPDTQYNRAVIEQHWEKMQRERLHVIDGGMDEDGGPPILLASFSTANTDGQSQRAELDALGYYSRALEAAKAWPQAKGEPQQVLKHLEKSGVKKTEVEATKLAQFLEGKKSVSREEVVSYLRENRVEVREAVYGGPVRRDADGRPLRDQPDAYTETRWSPYSLAKDDNNPSYRETVVHLPKGAMAPALQADADAVIEQLRRDDTPELRMRWHGINQEIERTIFRDGHFPEPNVVFDIMSTLNVDAKGDVTYVPNQVQSSWSQKIRDATRDAVARQLFDPSKPEVQARIAELERRLEEAHAVRNEWLIGEPVGWLREIGVLAQDGGINSYDVANDLNYISSGARSGGRTWTQPEIDQANAFLDDPRNSAPSNILQAITALQSPDKRFKELPDFLKAEVSAAISEARKKGEIPAGARDERKIQELRKRLGEAEARAESLKTPDGYQFDFTDANDLIRLFVLTFGEERPRLVSALQNELGRPYYTRGTADRAAVNAALAEALSRVQSGARLPAEDRMEAMNEVNRLRAELRTAEAATPPHPFVNTTDAWLTFALKHALRQAIAADAKSISIPSGATVLSYNPQGSEEGNDEFYDNIVPQTLAKLLKTIDPSIKPYKVDTVASPVDGRQLGRGFTVFPITDKVREYVEREGLALMAIASARSQLGPEDGRPAPTLRHFRPKEALPRASEPGRGTLMAIERDGKSIGYVDFAIESTSAPDDTAYIHYIQVSPGERLSLSDIRALREEFRRDYPSVSRFEGFRVSGAKGRQETIDGAWQSVVMAALAEDVSTWTGSYSNVFASRRAEFAQALEQEFAGMVGATGAVRVADRLFNARLESDEVVSTPRRSAQLGFGFQWLMQIALAPGHTTARIKGFHGVAAHMMRRFGGRSSIYTGREWKALVDLARKLGIQQELESQKVWVGNRSMSVWDAYKHLYAGAVGPDGRSITQEYLEQELVGRLAEHYYSDILVGKDGRPERRRSYGAAIDALLDRLAQILDAIRRALNRVGITRLDQLFDPATMRVKTAARQPGIERELLAYETLDKVRSGEMAARVSGGRREPTFDQIPKYDPATFFPNTPSPSEAHLASEEGIEARGLFPAIRAFHGSPHDFDQFDITKIGTGEGAAAFGHGLYFAESEGVARSYRESLAKGWEYDGKRIDPNTELGRAVEFLNSGVKLSEAMEAVLPRRIKELREHADFTDRQGGYGNSYRAYADQLSALDPSKLTRAGRLYEVSLDVEPEQLLDWDKPLGEQSEAVKTALKSIDDPVIRAWQTNGAWPHVKAESLYRHLSAGLTRKAAAEGKHADASALLRGLGVSGIRYLDQGSRAAGEGSRNFVIFDDSLVKIVAKDGKPVASEERADVLQQMHQEQEGGDNSLAAFSAREMLDRLQASRLLQGASDVATAIASEAPNYIYDSPRTLAAQVAGTVATRYADPIRKAAEGVVRRVRGGDDVDLASFSSDPPARTGKYGSLPEEAAFRKLMGRQYEVAKASGDLSTQYDILGGRLNNDRSMPQAMREAMELERIRIAREMGPEGRQAAGIPDPDVIEGSTDLASFSSSSPATVSIEDIPLSQAPPKSGVILAYHGTGQQFETFDRERSADDLRGFHFGTLEQAQRALRSLNPWKKARIIPAAIELRGSIVMDDEAVKAEFRDISDYMRALRKIPDFKISPATDAILKRGDDTSFEVIRRLFLRHGIDGIWYKNEVEGIGWSLIAIRGEGQVTSPDTGQVLFSFASQRPAPTPIENIGRNGRHPGPVLGYHGTPVGYDGLPDPERGQQGWGVFIGTAEQASEIYTGLEFLSFAPDSTPAVYPIVANPRRVVTLTGRPDLNDPGNIYEQFQRGRVKDQDGRVVRLSDDTSKQIAAIFRNDPTVDDIARVPRLITSDLLRQGIDGFRLRDVRYEGDDAPWQYAVWNKDAIRPAFFDPQQSPPSSLASFASSPESRPFALNIPGFDGSVTEKVKEGGERLRTYGVTATPPDPLAPTAETTQGPKGPSSLATSLIVSEQPDGSWELTFFKAEPDQLSRLPEIVAAIEQNDLGKPISPRGWLTPQGYAYWSQVAPDKVKFHVNAGEMFGGMWASPRAVEFAEAVLAEAAARETEKAAIAATDARFPRASGTVDGRVVRDKVPNLDSISASFENFVVLPGVRDVPFPPYEAPANPSKRVRDLAEAIAESGEINPLIVNVDKDESDVWIVEGGHRIDALKLLGAKSFPAVVVIDLESLPSAPISPDQRRLTEASAHLSRLKSSIPQEAFTDARREERFSLASAPAAPEYPTDAAIKLGGRVFVAPRGVGSEEIHRDAAYEAGRQLSDDDPLRALLEAGEWERGFVTNKGRYVDRLEAGMLAYGPEFQRGLDSFDLREVRRKFEREERFSLASTPTEPAALSHPDSPVHLSFEDFVRAASRGVIGSPTTLASFSGMPPTGSPPGPSRLTLKSEGVVGEKEVEDRTPLRHRIGSVARTLRRYGIREAALTARAEARDKREEMRRPGGKELQASIWRGEEPVGYITYVLSSKRRANDTAFITMIENQTQEEDSLDEVRWTLSDLRQLREEFRRLHPTVKWFEGERVSGAKADTDDNFQSIYLASFSGMPPPGGPPSGSPQLPASLAGERGADAVAFEAATREAKEYVLAQGRQDGKEHGVTVRPDGTSIIAKTGGNKSNFLAVNERETPELYQDNARVVEFHHNHPISQSFSINDIVIGAGLKSLKRLHAHGHNGSSYQAEFLLDANANNTSGVDAAHKLADQRIRARIRSAITDGRLTLERANAAYHWHLVSLILDEAGIIRYSFEFADQAAADRDIAPLREAIGVQWAVIVADARKAANVPDRRAGAVRAGTSVEGASAPDPRDTGAGRPGGEGGDSAGAGANRGYGGLGADPQLPITPASQGDIRGVADIIADLKAALGMTVTQGLYGMRVRDRAGGRTWGFRPRSSVRSQYDANTGVAHIRVATDIDAIAREGGRHIEQVFGAPMQAFLRTHAEELAVPAAPDTPVPALNPAGFSGIELDADTQRALVDAANFTRQWQAGRAAPGRNQAVLYDLAAQAAIAKSTVVRRLGRTVGDHLITDLMGQTARPADDYVRERYSATGVPSPRVAPTPSATELSAGFADFFRRYITDPDTVKREMPGVYVGFEQFLDANDPAMLEGIERVQLTTLSEDYKAYRLASASERLTANVASTRDQTAWQETKDFFEVRDQRERVQQWLSTLSYNTMDLTNPALKMQQHLQKIMFDNGVRGADGRPISFRQRELPHYHFRMFPQAFKVGHELVVNGVTDYGALVPTGPALTDAIQEAMGGTSLFQWSDKNLDRFAGYMEAQTGIVYWALWAKQHNKPEAAQWATIVNQYYNSPDIAKMLATLEDAPSFSTEPSMTPFAEYWQAIQEKEQANPRYRRASQMAREWQHRLLTLKWQAGLLTDAQHKSYSNRREFYTPFNRKFDKEEGGFVPAGASALGTFAGFKQIKGSQRPVVNVLASMARDAYATADVIQRNDMIRTFAELGDAAGHGGGQVVERIPREETMEANSRNFAKVAEAIKSQGYDEADAHAMALKMEGDFTDSEIHILYNPLHKGKGAVTMPFFEKGERKLVRFNDIENGQRMLAAMNTLGRGMSGVLMEIVAAPAALLRAGVILHPAYMLGNIAGDMQMTWWLTGAPPGYTHMRGAFHELSSYPKFRAFMQKFGIKPSDVAQMQDRLGLIGGGQLTASIAERAGNRRNLDLSDLRNKGYQTVDIRAVAGTGSAVGGAIAGGTLGTVAGPVVGGLAGGALGGSVGASIGGVLGERAARALRGDRSIAQLENQLKTVRRRMKALDRKSPDFALHMAQLHATRADLMFAIQQSKEADKSLTTRFGRGLGKVVGGAVGGLAGGVGGAIAAPALGPVVGATVGFSGGMMAGRLLFGAGAEAAFAKVSEFTETAGRRGVAEYATRRALQYDPSLPLIDAMREGVFTANDVLPFDRRGFMTGAIMRMIPFFNGNTQAISKAYRQTWMVEGDRGKIVQMPMLQGGLLGGASAAAATAVIGGPVGIAMGAGALTGAAIGRWALGKTDIEAMKLWGRHMLRRRNATGPSEFEEMYSKRDELTMRRGIRSWVILSIVGIMGGAISLLSGGGGDDEYADISRETKNTHWVFKLFDTWIRVKRFEFGMPAIITESLLGLVTRGDPRAAEKIRDGIIATHTPPLTPQMLREFEAMRFGIDPRTGRPITPFHLRDLPPHMRATPYTSEFARQWAGFLHQVGINASPVMIDYVLTTQLGYWGRETQLMSNMLVRGMPGDTREIPIIGPIINRFTWDPYRSTESILEFRRIMRDGQSPYVQASAGYNQLMRDGASADALRTYLVGLPPDQIIYSVLMQHFPTTDRITHPMNRAQTIDRIMFQLRREMHGQGAISTAFGSARGTAIALSPALRTQVEGIMQRITALEMWNALHDMGRPGWESGRTRDPTALYRELQASAPDFYAELLRRFASGRLEDGTASPVGDYATDRASWITVQRRVIESIEQQNMLGLRQRWDRKFRDRTGPARRRPDDPDTLPSIVLPPRPDETKGPVYAR